ncbi:alpha-ketoacid dehydrogenase subunit beta [Candidatus Kaiserbacteria bacterium]|nr:alpha-ketoacid dehydrogenase subunit beta [Candidatus Kaiserbacteria bacterium]
MIRQLKYKDAIREAHAQILRDDPQSYVIGLGVPGPTGIFGTTKGLQKEFGEQRVFDMPASENAMTGVALGTSLLGRRPIMVHMRFDFAVLSMEPLVNQIAKWHYMYGGHMRTPLTVRMIVGRGWGQGPQHSQSLQAWLAHVPGLKVGMPTTAHDVKGMLIAAARDDAPVVLVEHRWLYEVTGHVPEEMYTTPLDKAAVVRNGTDVTLAATSYMTLESLRAAEMLSKIGIQAEVVDLRSLAPIDHVTLDASIARTGRLVVSDIGHSIFGVCAEVIASVTETSFSHLKCAPCRIGLPHVPTPTTPALADLYYPRAIDIARTAAAMFNAEHRLPAESRSASGWLDAPDPSFTGPY